MRSQKLKPAPRARRAAPRRKKPASVVRFDVVPSAAHRPAAADMADVKATVERQAAQIATLRDAVRQQLESLTAMATVPPAAAHGGVLDATLRDAHATLLQGIEAVGRIAGAAPARRRAASLAPSLDSFVRSRVDRDGYGRMTDATRSAAAALLPADAVAIVASKGDAALLDLDGRRGLHFPQNDDGVYAGYYPSSSQQAIRHLEALREKGGQFLVFPATAAWWLDHYGELRRHLEARYRLIFAEPGECAIYDLRSINQERAS
jgi:hypothetical protein